MFGFRVVIFLGWLRTKASEPSLICYLTHSKEGKRYKGICAKATATDVDVVLGALIQFPLR